MKIIGTTDITIAASWIDRLVVPVVILYAAALDALDVL